MRFQLFEAGAQQRPEHVPLSLRTSADHLRVLAQAANLTELFQQTNLIHTFHQLPPVRKRFTMLYFNRIIPNLLTRTHFVAFFYSIRHITTTEVSLPFSANIDHGANNLVSNFANERNANDRAVPKTSY